MRTRIPGGDTPGQSMNRLVTVSHGTRLRAGNLVGQVVTARAARRLGVPGTAAYVELARPSLGEALTERSRADLNIVVPMLLSTGVHLRRDIPEVVAGMGRPAVITRGLGPDPLLAEVVVRRLLGAGARRDDAVVLVAAGSSDPAGLADLHRAGRLLAGRWQGPVRVATLSGLGPRVEEAASEARRAGNGRLAMAPYLLARGHFATKAVRVARLQGIKVIADVIGPDPLVSQLVARRYLEASAGLGTVVPMRARRTSSIRKDDTLSSRSSGSM